MVSNARLDLPEPERPVTTTSLSRGISTEPFLRLCTRAPCPAIVVRGATAADGAARPGERFGFGAAFGLMCPNKASMRGVGKVGARLHGRGVAGTFGDTLSFPPPNHDQTRRPRSNAGGRQLPS